MKMKILFSLVLISFLSLDFGFAQKLSRRKISEGITVSLPKDFLIMSDDDIALKYPSSKKPLAMYTSLDRNVDFGLNVSKAKWPGQDLNLLKGVYRATILELYPKVDIINEEVKTVNKKDFIVFEFNSQFESQRKYTYLMYALVKDKVYLFNFTCPQPLKDKWQPTAHSIMNSIKMRVNTPIEVKHIEKPGVKKYVPKKVEKK